MYREIKLTKRFSVAFEIFPKTAKKLKLKKPVYHTGISKVTDETCGFNTYFFVLYRFRIMVYVQHKHHCVAAK